MRLSKIIILLFLSINIVQAQSLVTTHLTNLETTISESSGLIMLGNKLITHNDSGGDAYLYEIDTITGNIVRTVTIANAINHDWEEIAKDNQYIYIADIGNNDGDRTDLKIYRVLISDYLNTTNDTVFADSICFSYSDQTNFTPLPYFNNYDAEAFIATNNSLFIMTKNWLNQKSNLYRIPKLPGTYQLQLIDSLDTQGLITGATYNADNNLIVLCGYSMTNNFIIKISQFDQNNIFNCNYEIVNLQTQDVLQIEAICPKDTIEYYLTSESSQNGDAALFRINTDLVTGIKYNDNSEVNIYPNPVINKLTITGLQGNEHIRINDVIGKQIPLSHFVMGNWTQLNFADKPSGIYFLTIKNKDEIRVFKIMKK